MEEMENRKREEMGEVKQWWKGDIPSMRKREIKVEKREAGGAGRLAFKLFKGFENFFLEVSELQSSQETSHAWGQIQVQI